MTISKQRVVLYGISNCDTVKRARAWLAEQGIEVHFHDFKKMGVPEDRLLVWLNAVGWETLLNRKGNAWRGLSDSARAAVVDSSSAQQLMLAQASVIKRPVIEWESGAVTVGFKGTLPMATTESHQRR